MGDTHRLTNDDLIARVRAAWAEVLAADTVDSVPLDVNFLEAGGSSLLLIMLWEELHGLTGRTLKVSDLFRHGTVRAQARLLEELDGPAVPIPAPVSVGTSDRGRLLGHARRGGDRVG